jgi:glycosyltransferase involved in cell wall biosynthesis
MDADGQHNPEEIPLFLKKAEDEEADIILGFRRMSLKNMPLVRLVTNKVTSLIISRLSGQRIPDSQCGYRLIKRKVLKDVELETSKYDTSLIL